MKCPDCHASLIDRRATDDAPYPYTMSGLKGLRLAGIKIRQCLTCKVDFPVIPKVGQLHRAIAESLLNNCHLLRGEELRFLRKHAGLSAQSFAQLLAIEPSHLSRVENGHYISLGASTDKLARAIIAARHLGGDLIHALLLAPAKNGLRRRRTRHTFVLERNHWQLKAEFSRERTYTDRQTVQAGQRSYPRSRPKASRYHDDYSRSREP